MMNEQQQGSTRALSDLDARLTAMKQRMVNLEDTLDAKVVQVGSSFGLCFTNTFTSLLNNPFPCRPFSNIPHTGTKLP